jgi:hypothetical protein
MSNSGNSVKNEAIREVAFGSITAGYVALGAPLTHDAFRVTVFNNTDTSIYFTVDPAMNTRKQPRKSGRILDDKTDDMYCKAGTQFYVKYDTVPTEESFWIEIEYV